MARNNWIVTTFSVEGIHCYPNAKTDPALKEVSFLGNSHRHLFYFKVYVGVGHLDRQIEFILLKRELQNLYGSQLNANNKSCEMLANELMDYLNINYPDRPAKVYVFEDNENGALCESV